jgi:hypothetical protein
VLHAGGVLQDATLPKQTAAGVRAVYGPKVSRPCVHVGWIEALSIGLATLAAARSAALRLRRHAYYATKHHQCTMCAVPLLVSQLLPWCCTAS